MTVRPTVTMKDVAVLAGVSVGTVSNVLNSPHIVADATRRRVLEVIERVGWVRNESARQLRAGRSRSIGMVVMDIANPFFTDVLSGVEGAVMARGLSVHLGNSAQDPIRESTHLELFEQQRVRGVLLAPSWGSSPRVDHLRRRGIPVVIVDRTPEGTAYCSVAVDDIRGGTIAMSHLLELGHVALAFVGGPPELPQVRDRRIGAERAVLAVSGGKRRLVAIDTAGMDVASGIGAAHVISAMPVDIRPTAVFAANDLLAIGMLQGLVSHGLAVPTDISLIGFDDIEFAAAAAVPLSSVRQPRNDIGERAAELLFDEIDALDAGAVHHHQQIKFTPELRIRQSTAVSR